MMVCGTSLVILDTNEIAGGLIINNEVSYVPHTPIRIDSNADFGIGINGVSAGDGSPGTPWIIEDWDINGTGVEDCLYIGNTTDYFEVRDCYLHDASGFFTSGLSLYNVTNGIVNNNNLSTNRNGINLWSSSNNTIKNNNASDNTNGIHLDTFCDYNTISNNNVSFGSRGIWLQRSSNNIISNNNVSNTDYGIYLNTFCDYNTLTNNTISSSNYYGIYIYHSSSNTLTNNIMIDNSIFLSGNELREWNTHTINTSNIMNGKPVHYWKNQTGGTVPPGAGEIILANCSYVVIENQDVSGGSVGILLGFSDNNTLMNNVATSNGYTSIYLEWSSNNTITNNNASNSFYGIYLEWSSNNTITNNSASNNYDGIYLFRSSRNILANNTVLSNNHSGIYLYTFCDYNTITNNTASSNNYNGIHFYNSDYNTITNNTAYSRDESGICLDTSCNYNILMNNTVSSNNLDGIYLYSSSYNTLTNNTASLNNRSGIYLETSCNNNIITNNSVSNNYQGIICLLSSSSNTFTNNTVSSSDWYGIYIGRYSNSNTLTSNMVSNNYLGIRFYRSSSITLKNNMMTDDSLFLSGDELSHWNTHTIDTSNTVNGKPVHYWKNQTSGTVPIEAGEVILANCTNVLIENQNISDGEVGIQLGFSDGNIITKSTVSNSYYGIHLDSSKNNTITDNTATNNTGYGIILWLCSGNKVYHNNLINNNGLDNTGNNFWDNGYPSGGNYWNTWTTPDTMSGPLQDIAGSDWIVDDPRIISGGAGALDNYPLVYPVIDGRAKKQPFRINGDADFDEMHGILNWATGNGSTLNPWIIEGYDINGTGYGYCIYIGNTTEHFVVKDCNLHEANGVSSYPYYYDCGLTLYNVTNGSVSNNILTSHGAAGVFTGFSEYNNISYNECSGSWVGTYDQWSNKTTVSNNTYTGNVYGLGVSGGSDNNYSNNEITGNTFAGAYLEGANNCNVTGNNISGSQYGLYFNVMNFNNTVTGNNISNTENGTYFHYQSGFTNSNNTISNNNYSDNTMAGIRISPMSEYTNISENTFTGPGLGVLIFANNTTVTDNDLSNLYSGVWILSSSNNNITSNTISQNVDYGISILSSELNRITGNTVSNNNGGGIELIASDNNTISSNNITDNAGGWGLTLNSLSDNNRIYHNNFINNLAFDDGLGNQWDIGYPSGGNYWSDYVGTDLNYGPGQNLTGSDGIGDSNYTNIAGGSGAIDQYPLMSPFEYVEYDIPLGLGWQLFAFPVRLLDMDGSSVFPGIMLDAGRTYDTQTSTWLSYISGRPSSLNDPIELYHFKGYWINFTIPGQTLTVRGDRFASPLSIPLYAGWNLVGFPSLTPRSISAALAGTGYDLPVEGFNASAPYHITALADTYMMQPGEGYWVHVPADTVWVVDW
jgi:parallel beta-helix repeat protein